MCNSLKIADMDESSEFFEGYAVLVADAAKINQAVDDFFAQRGFRFRRLTAKEEHQKFLKRAFGHAFHHPKRS